MEANGFFHYRETVSLVQLATDEELAILDPLAVKDLSSLGELFRTTGIRKVLHGCDYDLRSFDRQYGFHFSNIRDTATATQLLNPETMGLGRALETYLGVKVNKSTRLQRSDWSRRPIPADALEYAIGDVMHLLRLQDVLDEKLTVLGRSDWLAEECTLLERIRYEPPPEPAQACFSAKGTFDLDPRELAVFKELYLLREQEAERMDRPPFKVVSNDALLALARDPDRSLDTVPNANRKWLHAVAPRIRAAVERGFRAPAPAHPSRLKRHRSPWNEESRERWRNLHAVRKQEAAKLNIAPALLWPTRSLEQIALSPEIVEEELSGVSSYGVRQWQRAVFGSILATTWNGIK